MKRTILLAALFSAGIALTASAQGATPAQQQAPAVKTYHLDGKVVSVKPASKTAVIDAKAIPGFMSAMAMPYTFKDSTELAKLKVGDHITADIVVTGGKALVQNVKMAKDSTAK